MKLQQIQYFCAACRYGNITRAAGELHVSQPSISMAIRDLEKEFGLLLIQRNNKGFAMTKEGMYFYEKAEILLEQADELAQMMGVSTEEIFKISYNQNFLVILSLVVLILMPF